MPLRAGTKQPMFAHKKEGEWSRERSEAYAAENPNHKSWGMLLDGLIAVDCDDEAAVAWVESQEDAETREALSRCAVQETRKGRHYVFYRPSWADAEGYWDGARQKGDIAVDVKTRCSTGTRGLLTVAPSKDKRWQAGRAPWEVGELPEMPRALLEKVGQAKQPRRNGPKRSAGKKKMSEGEVVKREGEAVKREEQQANRIPRSFGASCQVEKLLLMLGKGRWESYTSWRDIATALKNSHGEEYRGAWDMMSRVSPKYEADAASRMWASVGRGDYDGPRLTLRTLERWAREDDPHAYAMYRATTISPEVMENWDKGDYGLGQIAYALLRETVKKTGPGRGDYYYFDKESCRWKKVDEGRMKSVACRQLDETLRDVEIWLAMQASQLQLQLQSDGDDERRRMDAKKKEAANKVAYVRSQRGISNVMGFAGPLLMDEMFEQRLDSHRNLVGIKGGGVVDLKTGERRARKPEDMVYNELDVLFPTQEVPAWMHSLMVKTMAGDEDMARFLQMLLGYGITGEVCEEIFAILTGNGRNGKGLLTQSMQTLLGNFYREMNCATISDSRVCSNIDAERAKLQGARIAVFSELRPGEKLKTNEVQLLTGGDGIPAKALYKDPITIQPQHLAILATNYLPEMSPVIMAMVERTLCVEFPVSFRDLMPGEEETQKLRQCDKTLKERMKSVEGQEALFAWLVEGAVAWYAAFATGTSLKRLAPLKVREATRKYLEDQDRLRAFLQEHCEFGEELKESGSDMYDRYLSTVDAELGNVSRQSFHQQMKSKGFEKKNVRLPDQGVVKGYEGLALKPAATMPDELDG